MTTQSEEPPKAMDWLAEIRAEWVRNGIMDADSVANKANSAPRTYDVAEQARKSRLGQFRALCPEEFLAKIDRDKLPNPAAWDRADTWDGRHPGLWLWSHTTGRAKSRMLWRHFGRLFVECNRRCVRIGGIELGEAYFTYHMRGDTDAFYARMMRCDAVFIDDLDKIALRNDDRISIPRMLHDLFNKFYETHKAVLVTANEPIAFFHEKLGDSADRRIKAVCATEIEF